MVLSRVRRTIRERGLIRRGDSLLVACSGGPDSVALVHVLARLQRELELSLTVVTVDHGLRADSSVDARCAAELASALGLPFRAERVEVGPDRSVQSRAREARYRVLGSLAKGIGADLVAVGHTLDDQAETVLARVLRGSGIKGLAGINPQRDDGVIRPLIDCRRAAILNHVKRFGLRFAVDPTNADRRFERVRIRQDILPRLEAERPGAARHLAALADDAESVAAFVQGHSVTVLSQSEESDGSVRCGALRLAPAAARRGALCHWIERGAGARPGRDHIEAIDRAILQGRGEVVLPGGWLVRVSGGRADLEWERAVSATWPIRRCADNN